jgi:hypothetical protein
MSSWCSASWGAQPKITPEMGFLNLEPFVGQRMWNTLFLIKNQDLTGTILV